MEIGFEKVCPVLVEAFDPPIVSGVAAAEFAWEGDQVEVVRGFAGREWVRVVLPKDLPYEFPAVFNVNVAGFLDFFGYPKVFGGFGCINFREVNFVLVGVGDVVSESVREETFEVLELLQSVFVEFLVGASVHFLVVVGALFAVFGLGPGGFDF